MHVLLEGSVQYEVRFILQHFFDTGTTTLDQVNNVLSQLNIGYYDEKNRPPLLRETAFNGQVTYKLKQTAEQARIFLKNLPFILHEFQHMIFSTNCCLKLSLLYKSAFHQ